MSYVPPQPQDHLFDLGGVHMCVHTSSASAHIVCVQKLKKTLSLPILEVFRCVRTRHLPSASFILHLLLIAHCSIFYVCRQISGWQIIPTSIIILIEINHQITEYVCKNPHLYILCLSQYNSAKITTNTWVSDALELDIDVSCQCYFVVMFYFFKLINIY